MDMLQDKQTLNTDSGSNNNNNIKKKKNPNIDVMDVLVCAGVSVCVCERVCVCWGTIRSLLDGEKKKISYLCHLMVTIKAPEKKNTSQKKKKKK